MKESKKIINRKIFASVLFLIFIIVTFYFTFRGNNYREMWHLVLRIDIHYILIAIFCTSCFAFFEANNISSTLKILGNKVKFRNCYKYAIVGFFFSSVTPSSSGGDPMQLYFMSKDGVPISHATISLLVKLLCFQVGTFILGIICYVSHYKLFDNNLRFLIYFGLLFCFLQAMFILLSIFYKKIAYKLIELVSKILKKLHYKKIKKLEEKLYKMVEEYHQSTKLLKKNKWIIIRILLMTILQLLINFSIPYWIYLSFGLREHSIITFIAVQSVLFVSVSSLPFPGAVGISEGTFLYLYRFLFPEKLLIGAMLLSRGISFYLFLLISGIVVFVLHLKKNIINNNFKVNL